jgi:hypothetical protein
VAIDDEETEDDTVAEELASVLLWREEEAVSEDVPLEAVALWHPESIRRLRPAAANLVFLIGFSSSFFPVPNGFLASS